MKKELTTGTYDPCSVGNSYPDERMLHDRHHSRLTLFLSNLLYGILWG